MLFQHVNFFKFLASHGKKESKDVFFRWNRLFTQNLHSLKQTFSPLKMNLPTTNFQVQFVSFRECRSFLYTPNSMAVSGSLIYHLYIANWVIIYHLPSIKGTRKLLWQIALFWGFSEWKPPVVRTEAAFFVHYAAPLSSTLGALKDRQEKCWHPKNSPKCMLEKSWNSQPFEREVRLVRLGRFCVDQKSGKSLSRHISKGTKRHTCIETKPSEDGSHQKEGF